MDTLEILSSVRNTARLHTENNISTPQLLDIVNRAMFYVSQMLYPLYKEDLVKKVVYSHMSGTLTIPRDVQLLVNVYYDGKLANKVTIEKKPIIGTPQIPASAAYPVYVQLGSVLEFYPTASSTDIVVEYRKRIAPLVFGSGEAIEGSYITLDTYAPVRDDILNNYWMAMYTTDLQKHSDVMITDYTGSNKRAYGEFPDGTFFYALVPILPDEFHTFIVDYALVLLTRAGLYKDDPDIERKVNDNLLMCLQINGVEYKPSVEGRSVES